MKHFLILLVVSACSGRQVNIPDSEDMNLVPQSMESRESEAPNKRDSLDGNKVPFLHEEREEEEERNYYNDPPVF